MASTVWKGHLTFGLVSFPIKLYSAARSESISFNQLHKADGSRVKTAVANPIGVDERPPTADEEVWLSFSPDAAIVLTR